MKFTTKILNRLGLHTRGQVQSLKRSLDGFAGARVNRLTADWVTSVLHADQMLRWDLRKLKARCRELVMNSDIGKRFVELSQNNIVGSSGIQLQMNVTELRQVQGKTVELQDTVANDRIEENWDKWSKAPTVDGRLTLLDVLNLVVGDFQTDGEAIVRIVENFDNEFRFALQPLDTDLLDTTFNRKRSEGVNEIRMGVEIDRWGRRIAGWFKKFNMDLTYGSSGITDYAGERERIPFTEILHIFHQAQPGQTRGIPPMAAVLISMRMLSEYEKAELTAARVAAGKMGFYKTQSGSEFTGDSAGADTKDILTEVSPGSFEEIPEGWEIQAFDPQHPTQAFEHFVKAVMKKISSGLGVSYVSLASDLEGVNYSSIRAGVLEEREQWKKLQSKIIQHFMRPVFERWLAVQLLSGKLGFPATKFDKFNKPNFIARRWPWVDPMKDIQASILALDKNLTSRSDILAEQGKDLWTVLQAKKREDELAKEAGIDLNSSQSEKKEVKNVETQEEK